MSSGFWNKHKNNIFRLVEVSCYVLIFIAGYICVKLFIWGREIHFMKQGYMTDVEALGNFGDFMAGTIGCVIAVVSMYLLFRTLKSQRAATNSNNELMTVQRFNDLFFRLIDLYHELSADLSIKAHSSITVDNRSYIVINEERRDKDFFDSWQSVMKSGYQPSLTFNDINNLSLHYYNKFYETNRNKLGAYFRTLYRILELIDESPILDTEKRNYAKILRAQLCESELFMLYYNSQTKLGQKLGKYLWKYHILKHLPFTETIEIGLLYPNLTAAEKDEINQIYSTILSATKHIVSQFNGKVNRHEVENDNLKFRFECRPITKGDNNKKCDVSLTVKTKRTVIYPDCPNLRRMSEQQWREMIDTMLAVINQFSLHTLFSIDTTKKSVRKTRYKVSITMILFKHGK